uniref:Uncharacterized protein n=1 Tax=viral metagenome TaxID=1070528 RepID=A0A6M3JA57_9ZZZZ
MDEIRTIKALWKKHRNEGESLRAFARRYEHPAAVAWLAHKARRKL